MKLTWSLVMKTVQKRKRVAEAWAKAFGEVPG